MNMNKYQHNLYIIILNQIQDGTTFNELVVRVLQHLRLTDNNIKGNVDRVDIRAAITRLAIYGAIDINQRVITHNLPTDTTLTDYLRSL